MTSAWLRERPTANGSGPTGTSTVRWPDAIRNVISMPLPRRRATTTGVDGVVGAGTAGAIGVAGTTDSPRARSSSCG